MQLFLYSHLNNINQLVDFLISSKVFAFFLLHKLKKSPDWLFDNFENNELTETNLYLLIRKYQKGRLKELIVFFVDYADGRIISDRIFELLFGIKKQHFQDDIVVALSHKTLQPHMLSRLCDYGITFEPFFELSVLYYTDDSFGCNYLEELLRRFFSSKFSYMHEELFKELSFEKTNDEKKAKLVSAFINHGDSAGDREPSHKTGDSSMS